jgi:RHS repeat-associated protein
MTRQRFLATLIGLLLSGAVFASTPSEVVAWSGGVAYSYDGSGNIRQIGRDRFAYDVTSRLIQAEVNGIRRDYGYDAFGNRIDCTQARGTAEQSDCQQGRTISPADNRIVGVPHDVAGNVQSLNQHLYVYDAVNMVTRDTAGVLSREFIYTADDERIATHETPSGSWRWTARDPSGKVLREFTSTDGGSWQWAKDYVYRDDKLVASRHPAGGFVETYHYHLDHLGTPRRITNALDATVGFHDYHAFGPEVPGGANEPSLTPLKYTGHERDRWLGEGDDTLDYMHARYYSPGLGRFLSVDPGRDWDMSQPQSWNMYPYVRSNPVSATDPTGRYIESLIELVSIGIGAHSFVGNVRNGHYGSAALDAGGVVLDVAALVVPVVPGGVGAAIKGVRAANAVDNGIDATKGAGFVEDAARGAAGGKRAGKKHTQAAKRKAREASGPECPKCKTAMTEPTQRTKGGTVDPAEAQGDHIIPRAKGGDGATVKDQRNIEIICANCNNIKRDRIE